MTIELTEENRTRYVKGLGVGAELVGEAGMSRAVAITRKLDREIGCKPGAKIEQVHHRTATEAFRRLVPLPPALPDLPKLAREVPHEKLHALLGALEEAKHVALARLLPAPSASTTTAPTSKSDRLLLSADDVAKMIGLPRKTIYDLAKRKGRPEYLPPVRVLSRVMFRLEDVESWVAKRVEAQREPAGVVALRSR